MMGCERMEFLNSLRTAVLACIWNFTEPNQYAFTDKCKNFSVHSLYNKRENTLPHPATVADPWNHQNRNGEPRDKESSVTEPRIPPSLERKLCGAIPQNPNSIGNVHRKPSNLTKAIRLLVFFHLSVRATNYKLPDQQLHLQLHHQTVPRPCRELCYEAWTNLRLSPMFGCICPNNHMKRRCDKIFSVVNHNPCVGKCSPLFLTTLHLAHLPLWTEEYVGGNFQFPTDGDYF